jgi:hypothetical protein
MAFIYHFSNIDRAALLSFSFFVQDFIIYIWRGSHKLLGGVLPFFEAPPEKEEVLISKLQAVGASLRDILKITVVRVFFL